MAQPQPSPKFLKSLHPGLGAYISQYLDQSITQPDTDLDFVYPDEETEKQVLQAATDAALARESQDVECPADRVLSVAAEVLRTERDLDDQEQEAARIRSGIRYFKRRRAWLRQIGVSLVQSLGKIPLKDSRGWGFGVSLQERPSVEVQDPNLLPREYRTLLIRTNAKLPESAEAYLMAHPEEATVMDITPDKVAILKHFQETGEVLPGCQIVNKASLRISRPRPQGQKEDE